MVNSVISEPVLTNSCVTLGAVFPSPPFIKVVINSLLNVTTCHESNRSAGKISVQHIHSALFIDEAQ